MDHLQGRIEIARVPGPCGHGESNDTGLDAPLRVVNVGLDLFAEQLEAQGVAVDRVDWQPPAGGADMAALLAQLEDEPA